MFRIHFLQQWYNLSDPGVEEAIYGRNSFQKFLELDLISDTVPDETTILNFRHLLEKHDLQRKLFNQVQKMLEEACLLIKEGTIADASIVNASNSTKNKEKKRDPEMNSTKKGNQWYFGMKAHIGVDSKRGLVHSVECTTAKTHDREMFDDLLHGEEKAIFGDKGYAKDEEKKLARGNDIAWCVMDKGRRGQKLSNKQKKRNKKLSSVRAKVEHPFQVIKCQWGHVKTRYKGLAKNVAQFILLFGLFNLYRTRRYFLQVN